jgi:hypothetical protein
VFTPVCQADSENEKATQTAWLITVLLLVSFSSLRSCLFGPISQMDVLLDLTTFVPVFLRLVRPISSLPERILSCPEQIADYIQ